MSASSNNIAVSVRGLNKSYSIAHQAAKHSTFTEALLDRARHPFRHEERETFDALKDVSFDIKKGEVVGIIGRNGAGKSTLLKILSRITEPTSGEIDLYGRVGSLLEVGTGFHPELTGRENIFLNGAILGMSRAEIRKQFEAIVDFSGVEKFLDTPVKRYSSGMYVRLAFAVAAHLRSEILIVDEVLAVGDSDFQKKCLGKMQNVASSGRTVLFVSHNMAAVQTLCSSGIVLKNGTVDAFGAIDECVEAYAGNHPRGDYWHAERPSDVGLAFTRIRASLLGEQPEITLELDLTLEGPTPLGNVFLAADVSDSTGVVVMQAMPEARGSVQAGGRGHELVVSVDLPPLIPGRYLVSLWVGPNHATTIHHVKECVAFEILDSPIAGRAFPHTRDHGCVVPKSRCELRSETQAIQICRTGARNTVPIL